MTCVVCVVCVTLLEIIEVKGGGFVECVNV